MGLSCQSAPTGPWHCSLQHLNLECHQLSPSQSADSGFLNVARAEETNGIHRLALSCLQIQIGNTCDHYAPLDSQQPMHMEPLTSSGAKVPGARQGPVMHSLQTCIEDLGTELGRCGLYKWQTEELGALSPRPTFRCQGSSRPWARPSSHGPLHLFPGDLIYPQLFKLGLSSSVWFLSLDSQVPCILDRSALLSHRHLQRGMSKVAVLTSLPIPSFPQSSP